MGGEAPQSKNWGFYKRKGLITRQSKLVVLCPVNVYENFLKLLILLGV